MQVDEQTNLRLPIELKGWLKEQAQAARRSLTAEVIVRLEESRTQHGATPQPQKGQQ